MEEQGFEVTKNYLMETAWVAKYTHGAGGRTIGVNSEMDALPGVGHACGHNLIAIAGVAVACAIKSVLETLHIHGSVVLLGTPGPSHTSSSRRMTDYYSAQVKKEEVERWSCLRKAHTREWTLV